MKKFLIIVSIIFTSLILFAIAASFILPIFLESPIKKAMIEEFDKQTKQGYQLDVAVLNINILGRSISVDSISVEPDSTTPYVQRISAESITVDGIKWRSLIGKSFPDFKSITIIKPKVDILERDLYSEIFSGNSDNDSSEAVEEITTFALTIKNGSGFISDADGNEIFSISDFSVEASKVDINSLLDGTELLFMDDLVVMGAGLTWQFQSELYDINIGNFSFDKMGKAFSITNMSLKPLQQKYAFSESKGYQLDRIDLKIPELFLKGLDLNSLTVKHLDVDEIEINSAWMEVFRNKQIDRKEDEKIKPLLNELANSFDLSIGIDNINISNATIIYDEHKPPSDSSASISFDDINATITNIRTVNHPQFSEDTLKIQVETLFMDSAPLTLDVSYPVFNENNSHTVKAELGRMDPHLVHKILAKSGFVRVETGIVESLKAEFEVKSDTSSGEVLLLYRDLKISFLEEDSGEQRFQERLKDFVANTFSIKSENTEEDPRVGKIQFERETNKSIFAYWWKSLLSGIKDTIQ